MDMKMNRINFNNVYQSYSTTASFEGYTESTADSTTLAEMMLYISFPFDLEEFEEKLIKGHNLDFTLEKIMKKYDPALRTLAKL
ncbi:MAG: hypothetical protein SVO01_13665 [Thermotogota bacterium]|nr:hypothetical protein [Thermotogota bacterium]